MLDLIQLFWNQNYIQSLLLLFFHLMLAMDPKGFIQNHSLFLFHGLEFTQFQNSFHLIILIDFMIFISFLIYCQTSVVYQELIISMNRFNNLAIRFSNQMKIIRLIIFISFVMFIKLNQQHFNAKFYNLNQYISFSYSMRFQEKNAFLATYKNENNKTNLRIYFNRFSYYSCSR